MRWTKERVALLKKLWTDGLSASQIADRLGGFLTRNAVIGKLHRLGLSRHDQPKRAAPIKRTRPLRTTAFNPPVKLPAAKQQSAPATELRAEPPSRTAVSFMELKCHHCRWPVDLDQYCGADAVDGRPYCEYHAFAAYQRPQRR